jgi:hypothetical protein
LFVTKQIEESLKGVKNTSYCSQFAAPTSAAESASAIAVAPASAANVTFIPPMHFNKSHLSFCY